MSNVEIYTMNCPECKSVKIIDLECPGCEGFGEIDYEPCPDCDGSGITDGSYQCANCGEVFDD